MFDFDNIDIEKEMALMTESERNTLVMFLMKLTEAFKVDGLDKLGDSQSTACQEIYKVYSMMKDNMPF